MSSLAVLLLATLSQASGADAGMGADGGAQDQPPVIVLGIGLQKVLTFTGVTHVAIGDPKIAEVKALGTTQVLIIGLAEGDSGLLLFREGRSPASYTIRVHKTDGCGINDLRQLLTREHRADVRMVGDRIFIDGEIGSIEELERLATIFELYPQVKNLAHLDPKLIRASTEAINDTLVRAGLQNVRASPSGDGVVLEGAVADENERRKAQAIADSMFEPIRHGMAALKKAKPAPTP